MVSIMYKSSFRTDEQILHQTREENSPENRHLRLEGIERVRRLDVGFHPCVSHCHYSTSQGIDCFDYSKEKSIIVTGGADYIVRLWDPYVTMKPIALLKEHKTTVVDVVIHEGLNQVFSYSKDCVSQLGILS